MSAVAVVSAPQVGGNDTYTFTVPAGVLASDVAVLSASYGAGPEAEGGHFVVTSSNAGLVATELFPVTQCVNIYGTAWVLTGVKAGDTVTINTVEFTALAYAAAWYRDIQSSGFALGARVKRTGAATTIGSGTVETSAANSTVVTVFVERASAGSTTVSTDAGVTQDVFQAAVGGSQPTNYIGSTAQVSVGTSVPHTATYPNSSGNAFGFSVAFKPASAGSTSKSVAKIEVGSPVDGTSDYTYTVPAGVQATDVALFVCATGAPPADGTVPIITSANPDLATTVLFPFTPSNNVSYTAVLIKGLVAGNTFTLASGAFTKLSTAAAWYRGAKMDGYVLGARQDRTAPAATAVAPSINVPSVDHIALTAFVDRVASPGPSTSVSLPADLRRNAYQPGTATGGGEASVTICEAITPTAGASGAKTATYPNSSMNGIGFQLALAPLVTGTPVEIVSSWVSGFDTTALQAGIICKRVTQARIVASTTPTMTSPINGTVAETNAWGWATSRLTGLTPNTRYYLAWSLDGVLQPYSNTVRTLTTAPVSFVATSSSCQANGSNPKAFDRIVADDPAFFAHQGDLHYADTTSETTWRNAFTTAVTASRMAGMLAKLPMSYVTDNHDWINGGDATSWPANANPGTFIRDLAGSSQFPGAKAVHRTWRQGRVRFIQLDPWTERSPSDAPESASKRMYSDEQEQWLYSTLTAATEPLIVLFTNWPLWRFSGAGRWGSYATQTARIKAWLAARPTIVSRLVGIGGDSHAVHGDTGVNQDALGNFPTLNASPLYQAGGVETGAWNVGSVDVPDDKGAYSRMTFTENGDGTLGFKWEAVQDDGVVLLSWSKSYGSATTPPDPDPGDGGTDPGTGGGTTAGVSVWLDGVLKSATVTVWDGTTAKAVGSVTVKS